MKNKVKLGWLVPLLGHVLFCSAAEIPISTLPQGVSTNVNDRFVLNVVSNGLFYTRQVAKSNLNLDIAAQSYRPVAGTGIRAATNGLGVTLSLYTPPSITSLVNDKNIVEVGSTISSTKLDWVLAGETITSQSINNGVGSLNVVARTTTHSSSYTTDRSYVLTASDGTTTVTASTPIYFRNYRYWGVSANSTLTDGQVIALSKEFATTRVKSSFSVSPSAQYIYVAYPASWGSASFTVNSLPSTAWTLVTRVFVNASGYSSSFNIYRTDTVLTGTYAIAVN